MECFGDGRMCKQSRFEQWKNKNGVFEGRGRLVVEGGETRFLWLAATIRGEVSSQLGRRLLW
jgi:hypothetical protein